MDQRFSVFQFNITYCAFGPQQVKWDVVYVKQPRGCRHVHPVHISVFLPDFVQSLQNSQTATYNTIACYKDKCQKCIIVTMSNDKFHPPLPCKWSYSNIKWSHKAMKNSSAVSWFASSQLHHLHL